MSYLTQSAIASNGWMTQRVAQCATEQGQADSDNWTQTNRRIWAAAPGWDEAWEYAVNTHPPEPPDPENPVIPPPYDPGQDEGVITDGMILSQVQAMLNAEVTPHG